ncbi:hypothetical protein IHE44_0008805 [Lamprotornis superbus]|uniref:Uncharacterized protein n=1 Tax=Lamprotornis superbus TaxID=245042 RepID=A0A835P064_9PASS|nr:hypothetical protein IHE44_0008805 [Lamprotornis superbus]
MYSSNKRKKLWREEKERLLKMTLEERRKEYLGDYVALKTIPTWMEDLKSKSESDGENTKEDLQGKKSLSEKVSLYRGDITLLEVDAIVNAGRTDFDGVDFLEGNVLQYLLCDGIEFRGSQGCNGPNGCVCLSEEHAVWSYWFVSVKSTGILNVPGCHFILMPKVLRALGSQITTISQHLNKLSEQSSEGCNIHLDEKAAYSDSGQENEMQGKYCWRCGLIQVENCICCHSQTSFAVTLWPRLMTEDAHSELHCRKGCSQPSHVANGDGFWVEMCLRHLDIILPHCVWCHVDAFRTVSVLPGPVCSPYFFVHQLLNPFIISDPNVIIDSSCHGYPGPFLCVLFLEKTSSIQAKHLQSWISSKVCDFLHLGSVGWCGMP